MIVYLVKHDQAYQELHGVLVNRLASTKISSVNISLLSTLLYCY